MLFNLIYSPPGPHMLTDNMWKSLLEERMHQLHSMPSTMRWMEGKKKHERVLGREWKGTDSVEWISSTYTTPGVYFPDRITTSKRTVDNAMELTKRAENHNPNSSAPSSLQYHNLSFLVSYSSSSSPSCLPPGCSFLHLLFLVLYQFTINIIIPQPTPSWHTTRRRSFLFVHWIGVPIDGQTFSQWTGRVGSLDGW